MPVRFEPAALRSGIKHSITEPLHSLLWHTVNTGLAPVFQYKVEIRIKKVSEYDQEIPYREE